MCHVVSRQGKTDPLPVADRVSCDLVGQSTAHPGELRTLEGNCRVMGRPWTQAMKNQLDRILELTRWQVGGSGATWECWRFGDGADLSGKIEMRMNVERGVKGAPAMVSEQPQGLKLMGEGLLRAQWSPEPLSHTRMG